MKKCKQVKAISFFLCIMLMITPVLQSNAFASTYVDTNSVTWTFTVNGDGTTATITACSQTSGDITIPSTIDGYTVTNIESGSISNIFGPNDNTTITAVTLPDSLIKIGNYAFYSCKGLTSIEIPNSVISIGSGALFYCEGLTNLIIPYGVNRMDNGALRGCSGLTTISIPSSMTDIGSNVLMDCKNLVSITIPDSVTSLGSSAIRGCSKLRSATIGTGVTAIDYNMFNGDVALTSVYFRGVAPTIADGAFNNVPLATLTFYYTSEKSKWTNPTYMVGATVYNTALWGDINQNASIDLQDVIFMQNAYLGKITLTAKQISIGDMNSNGNTNELSDCMALAQLYMIS